MKKILIVDDEESIGVLLSTVIRKTYSSEYCEVFFVTTGSEAIKVAKLKKPDLVFLDVILPDGPDGLEVCKYLKNDPVTAHISIVMISGYCRRDYIEQAFAAGAEDYLRKPFELSEFRAKIAEIFNRQTESVSML